AVPHGFTLVTPVTDARDGRWSYTWQAERDRPRLVGVAISHSPSPWIGDRGALLVQAGDGGVGAAGEPFGHDAERAHPHRYDVLLDDGRRVRATASDHGMVVRFELPGARRPVLRLGGLATHRVDLVAAGGPEPDGPGSDLVGWVEDGEPGAPGARLYLRLRLDRAVLGVRTQAGAVLLDLAPGDPLIEVQVATSHLSTDEAGAALDRELADGFDAVAARTEQRWADVLSRVQVRGASQDERRTLAANLVRMFTYPSSLTELSAQDARPVHASPHLADLPADGPRRSRWREVDGPMLTNHGFWDTYRTVWPAYHLLAPDLVPGLVDGFVQHAREGGWTPRWAAPGYLDAMVGTSLDVVLADAVACGVDLGADAYLAALRDATCVPPEPWVGRAGQLHAMLRGWVPADVPESVSWTLEGALADFGVAVLAGRRATGLGPGAERAQLEVEARYLRSRAAAYRHLYLDGFFRARGRDGAFVEPFDPALWGGGYTETNAWGTAFSVPHDGAGLVRLHGSRPALVEHLQRFFETPETGRAAVRGTYPQVIHEMVEARDVRLGMWAPSNQPAHHIPFMASVAGAPGLGHLVVHEALARLFTGGLIGQGYPGDEDDGELSAWWFLAVLGLYPLAPGSGEWLIGPPAFDELVVAPPGRDPLQVVAHRADRRDRYVHRVEVDGRPWSSTVLPHDRVRAGVRLDVWLGAEPNGWGTDPADAPSSLSDSGDPLLVDVAVGAALDGVAVPELVDDVGARTVRWCAGQELVVRVLPGADPVLGTLLLASPTELAWRVEGSPDGRTWTPVVARADLTWWWPDQLRPFDLPVSAGTVWVRVTLLEGVADLRQVEVLAPVP
ncbi:MAG: GH92 family glycosyl hydrolase, partial [Actinobacteria bacterium]|nr:GH92 family glycosyl hydrolase [Actinomycetota bacterium]